MSYPPRMTTHFFLANIEDERSLSSSIVEARALMAMRDNSGLYFVSKGRCFQERGGPVIYYDPMNGPRPWLHKVFGLNCYTKTFNEAYEELAYFELQNSLINFAANFHQVNDDDPAHIFNIDPVQVLMENTVSSWRVPSFPPVS